MNLIIETDLFSGGSITVDCPYATDAIKKYPFQPETYESIRVKAIRTTLVHIINKLVHQRMNNYSWKIKSVTKYDDLSFYNSKLETCERLERLTGSLSGSNSIEAICKLMDQYILPTLECIIPGKQSKFYNNFYRTYTYLTTYAKKISTIETEAKHFYYGLKTS